MEELNPEITHRRLVSFVIEHADGSEETVPGDGVAFSAGGNVDFTVADDTDDIIMSVDEQAGGENPYYRDKFNGLASLEQGVTVSGNAVDTEHPAWAFTDTSLYITALNGVPSEPITGAGFILGDACNTLGIFEVPGNRGRPESVTSTLSILNICIPCIDCLSYQRLEEYLDRLLTFYDYIFSLSYDNSTATIPEHPDGGVQETRTGVLQQFMAARRYWDFLVHQSTIKLGAQAMGQSLVAAGFYRNISDRTIGTAPNGITMTFTFTFQKVDTLGNVTSWEGVTASVSDVEILNRSGKCSAALGPTGVSFVGGYKVIVETISGSNVTSGNEIYSDVALVLMGTLLSNNPAYTYQIDVNLEVSHTHLGAAVDDNPISTSMLVYYRPPDAAEGEGYASSGGST
jgi:hypothetical protein